MDVVFSRVNKVDGDAPACLHMQFDGRQRSWQWECDRGARVMVSAAFAMVKVLVMGMCASSDAHMPSDRRRSGGVLGDSR